MIFLYFRSFILFTIETTSTVTPLIEQRTDPTSGYSPVHWYLQQFKTWKVLTGSEISVQEDGFSSGLLKHYHGYESAK